MVCCGRSWEMDAAEMEKEAVAMVKLMMQMMITVKKVYKKGVAAMEL